MDTWSTVLQQIAGVLGMVLASAIIVLAKRAIEALEAKNMLNLTASQRGVVKDAIATAVGTVALQLAAGRVPLAGITTASPLITGLAGEAYRRVATSADALGGVSPVSLGQVIVGAIGTSIINDPTIPTIKPSATAGLDQTFVPPVRPPV